MNVEDEQCFNLNCSFGHFSLFYVIVIQWFRFTCQKSSQALILPRRRMNGVTILTTTTTIAAGMKNGRFICPNKLTQV